MPQPSRDRIIEQFEKLRRWKGLRGMVAAQKLLRYLIEKAEAGEPVKQEDIARDVLELGDGFDKAIDTHVRGAVSKLRKKLDQYYEEDGKSDEVIISVPKTTPKAGYFAVFRFNSTAREQVDGATELRKGVPPVGTPSSDNRRRYLAWAELAWPSPEVIAEIAEHFRSPSADTSAIMELPGMLAGALGLRATLSFRQNATQAIRDAVTNCFSHQMAHPSRAGEESADVARFLTRRRHLLASEVGWLFYSDVDHPSVKQAISTIWPASVIGEEIQLLHLLSADPPVSAESIAAAYIERIRHHQAAVLVMPHVTWQTGACLDVKEICRIIRETDPYTTIIVDGAQATGHISLAFESCEAENEHIDFYVGCGHKWLQGPEALGFVRIGRRYYVECRACQNQITAADIVTDVSGAALAYRGGQIGTQHRAIARGLVRSLKSLLARPNGLEGAYMSIRSNADAIRNGLMGSKKLIPLLPPPNMRTGIVSFATAPSDEGTFSRVVEELRRRRFSPSLYPLEPAQGNFGGRFCRLSPSADLTEADLDELCEVLRDC